MSKKGTNWTEEHLTQKGLTAFEDGIYSNHSKIGGFSTKANTVTKETINAITSPRKKSKYNNKKVSIDGITFDSIKEGERYKVLKLHEKIGKIYQLQLQPVYELIVNNVLICRYKADFRYTVDEHGMQTIVEDVKGMKTPVYKLKKKLMKAIFNITIKET